MPFVSGSDTDMIDAPNGSSLETATPVDINPSVIPLRVNGHADVTFTSPYDPSRSGHVSPVDNQASWTTHGFSNDVSVAGDSKVEQKGKEKAKYNPLPVSSLRTGLCYDIRMMYHEQIHEDDHPEQPGRIYSIYKALVGAGLVDDEALSGVSKEGLMERISAREVTKDEALLAHSKEHWDYIASTSVMDSQELKEAWVMGDSVYFCTDSFFSAKLSCGGVIECSKAVVEGKVKNAIAVVRPPGHHAEYHKPMGFCLLNNVCVAARVMRQTYPDIRKVLILDWDVHHGNGTQNIFYDDPHVLYMSIHRFDNGTFYPDGQQGNFDKCGVDDGIGMNVNIPWNNPMGGMGDGDYMYAFQRVIMPIALEFNPDLVLISAGFDAAAGDELGKCMVTPAGYAHMTHMLMRLANGKVVVCLEGGYNLESISNSALAVTKVLLGEPPGKLHDGNKVRESAAKDVENCVVQQSRYWRCMRPRDSDMGEKKSAYRLHDVIRSHQSKMLFEKYKMTELKILRDAISTSFENQVLATTDSYKAETLVLLVHDPPSVWALLDSNMINRIAPHNALLEDVGNIYIDWAVGKGFAVLDVNIPQALTTEEGTLAKRREYDMTKQTEEVCIYLWDNYIEIADAKNVILMGVGDAFVGILYLLANRECRERVKGVIGIAGEENALRAIMIGIHGDPLIDWYYHNSLIFCAQEHVVWDRLKRGKKKFGMLRKSPVNTLQDVLRESFSSIDQWLMERIPPASIAGS